MGTNYSIYRPISTGGGSSIDFSQLKVRTVLWDGTLIPTNANLKSQATRIGVTSGSPYDAVNDRWGVNPNRGLSWQSEATDWNNFSLCFRLSQSQNPWACTVFWGSTSQTIANDSSIRDADGAVGMWIGRPTQATDDSFSTSGWNFFLTTSNGSNTDRAISNIQVFGGANKNDGGGTNPKANVQIPSTVLNDGPHDFIIQCFENSVTLYANNTKQATWTLSNAERDAAIGKYMGIAGDSGNVSSKTLDLYHWFAVSPAMSLP